MANVGFYVSIRRAGKYRLVSGPYNDKETAESKIFATAVRVEADYPWSWFDEFGACRIETPGLLPCSVYGGINA